MGASTTAAIYCRISSDPRGEKAGVERQRRECEALAKKLELDVVEVLIDNDVSAFSGVTRPGFERLLEGARAGHFGHVVVWHPDRLYRRLTDLLRITEAMKSTEIHTCRAGDVDLSTPSGRLMANTLGGIGQYESEHKADRIRTAAEDRARKGRMTCSQRPFGWRWTVPCPGGDECRHKTTCTPGEDRRARIGSRAGLVVHDTEAAILVQAYRDVAAGISLYGAAKAVQAAGIDMAPGTLRAVLLNPRNAGLVAYRGAIVADAADGLAIIDRPTYDRVQAILKDPSRRTAPGRPAGTFLGGGLARCPKCDGPLAASKKHNDTDTAVVYVCSRSLHFTRRRHLLDGPVMEIVGDVLSEIAADGALAVLTSQDDAADATRQEIAEVEARLKELAGLFGAGDLDARDYQAGCKTARARLDALSRTLRRRAGKPALTAITDNGDVRAAWGALQAEGDHERIRAILRELLVKITPQADGTIILEWQDWLPELPTSLDRPRFRIPGADERRAKVAELHRQGKTQLEIAAELGISRSTTRKDLRDLGLRDVRRGAA